MAAGRNGPFPGHDASQDRRVFAQIKPICVQLLGFSRPGPSSTSPQVAQHLSALREALDHASDPQPLPSPGSWIAIPPPPSTKLLGASLLNYAFFPISQLFQSQPKGPVELPQRTLQEAFGCLEVLCRHWWARWQAIVAQPSSSTALPKGAKEALDMWRQLLILGAIMLSGPPSQQQQGKGTAAPPQAATPKMSAETSLAVLRFLRSLLAPRQASPTAQTDGHGLSSQTPREWEWDGESELPSLDDEPDEDQPASGSAQTILYPTSDHLSLVATTPIKSPLLHALTAALDVLAAASSHSSSISLRATAIEVARIIAAGWIGAPTPSDPGDPAVAARAKADRLAPLLPGIVSKAVRVLTTSDDGKRLSTTSVPGELVARGLTLLGDVVVPVLDDGATKELRKMDAGRAVGGGDDAAEASVRVESLEDLLAGLQTSESKEEAAPATSPPRLPPANGTTSSIPHLATLKATLKNLTLAFRSLTSSTTPRSEVKDELQDLASHHHPAAQLAVVVLAASVLEHCGATLAWFASAEHGQPGKESLTSMLCSWILDLAPTCYPGATLSTAEQAAQERLDLLLAHSRSRAFALRSLAAEASAALKALPPAILAHRNALATRLAHRVSAVAAAALRCNSVAEQLVSEPETVQIWAERLVECLMLGGIDGGSSVLEDYQDGDDKRLFTPSLEHLEPAAGRAVAEMLAAWGQVCGRALLARLEASPERRKDASSSASTTSGPLSLIYWLADYSRRQRNLARAHAARGDAASALRGLCQSTAALFILRQVLAGVTCQLNDDRMSLLPGKVGKRARKTAHKLAGDLIKEIEEDWNEEAQLGLGVNGRDEETPPSSGPAPTSERQVLNGSEAATPSGPASHVRGLPSSPTPDALASRPQRFGPALNLSFVSAATVGEAHSSSSSATALSATTQRARLSLQLQHLRSLQLSLLSLCSALLGLAFQPKLLTTVYPLVSALTHPSPLVAHAAKRALGGIARAVGYADLLSLVRENVDYILGEASWRLVVGLGRELEAEVAGQQSTETTLDAGANNAHSLPRTSSSSVILSNPDRPLLSSRTPPLVLTEVMRLLGPSSLHLIEDSVDEILDALDRFHAFDDVADALLRVLDRLLEVMRQEADAAGGTSGEEKSPLSSSGTWAKKHPTTVDPAKDLEALESWLTSRSKARSSTSSGRSSRKQRDVQEELTSAFDKVEQNQKHRDDADPSSTAPPTPASRSQQLLVVILSKGLPFLSHSSPLIRARVLTLFTAGTQLLAPPASATAKGAASGKWSRREDLLLPLVNRAWPLILARLGWDASRPLPTSMKASQSSGSSEAEPMVHLAALSLLESLARCVPDFVGKRWVDEAWPRVRILLEIAQNRERDAKGQKRGEGTTTRFTTTSNSAASKLVAHDALPPAGANGSRAVVPHLPTFQPFAAHAPLTRLLLSTLSALIPLLTQLGPSIPDHALWSIVTHPLFVCALDVRQNRELRERAVQMMRAARDGDEGGSVWCLLVLEMRRGREREEKDGKEGVGDGRPQLLDVALSAAEIFALP